MEFRHVTAFIAIAEELHFGRAAARLHLTQPSLSAQLQKLEKSLGVMLVARNSREVTLTRAGREFEVQARLVVQSVENAARAARSPAMGPNSFVNVGYNFPASRHVLPYVLAEMSRIRPDTIVSLWEKRTGPQLEALADGTLDVAIVYGRPTAADLAFRRLLTKVPLVAVVGSAHRWAARRRVRFEELANESCVMFARDQCPAMYDSIFGAAAETRIDLDVAQTADDPGATAHVVSVKPLVGFASSSRAAVAGMGIGARSVAVGLVDPVPVVDLYAVWRAGDSSSAVADVVGCLEGGVKAGVYS